MTFLTSMAVIVIATALGTWINDHTDYFGGYMSDEELRGST